MLTKNNGRRKYYKSSVASKDKLSHSGCDNPEGKESCREMIKVNGKKYCKGCIYLRPL